MPKERKDMNIPVEKLPVGQENIAIVVSARATAAREGQTPHPNKKKRKDPNQPKQR